ncbi:capsid assembly protein [Phyllobacterium endophyticum]|uniref:capsid assembly protein n=1 Tax=Phyllobacterium endophyticum TaxID=1149773 RepID=UPI0011C9FB2A|nr:hypothetical protein [Phyllobacterium endophyticum]TXR49896.1 hypothetical protein FVA77_07740 [Phyllobacterium endophyticum]
MAELSQSGFTSDQVEAAIAEADQEEAAFRSGNRPYDAEEAANSQQLAGPEKFMKDGKLDTEALLKSYEELEKKVSQKKDEPSDGNDGTPDSELPDGGEETPDDEPSEINGVQITDEDRTAWAPFYEAVAKGEALPEEAYKLAKERFGVTDKSMVDAYMKGAIEQTGAKNAEYSSTIKSIAGGEAEYAKLTEWAAESLSEEEIAEYNEAVHSGDAKLAKAATQALNFRFKAEGGKAPSLLGGRTNATPTPGYANMDEMVRDVNDPRYDSDPAFRRQVEAKIALSEAVKPTRGSRSY